MQIERKETEYAFDPEFQGTQTLAHCQSLWVEDGKVALTRSIKKTGINLKSKTRWYSWKFDGGVGFRRTSTGKIMPYALGTKKNAISPLGMLDDLNDYNVNPTDFAKYRAMQAKFYDEVAKQFGITKTSDLYPVMSYYNMDRRAEFPQGVLPYMRADSYRTFIEQAYGKKNFRKDLVKAAANTDINAVAYTRPFRGLVPTDWIIQFLRNNELGLYMDRDMKSLHWNMWKELVPRLNRNTQRRLLGEAWEADTWREFVDTMRMFRMMPPDAAFYDNTYRTIHELHEAITPARRRGGVVNPFNVWGTKAIENTEIEYQIDVQAWHDFEVGNMRIALAEETDQMTEWGNEMRNCIGSYKSTATSGAGVYGAVYRKDKLIGNFEVKALTLKQLLGKANSKMDKADAEAMEEFFQSQGIDTKNYWGKPTPPADQRPTNVVAGNYNVGLPF